MGNARWVFQECFSSVSRVLGVSGMFQVFQGCFQSDSRVVQSCYKSDSRVFQEYFKSISWVSSVSKMSFKRVSMVFVFIEVIAGTQA